MTPRLYSISTVCLLKHYNQDYLLHSLRTDFTGSNGVGKSIIADLFQIVFVSDTRYIKFATEGIDKKKRRVERLPYESGIGYVFFNVEVTDGVYLTIGAAIFAQGHQLVKPFIISASMDLENDALDLQTFTSKKLVFSNDFLKPGREPYMLDELARILPDKYNLYIHYFSSKDERGAYFHWLYKNELLPINLVKEGNLKAYAKVIQSFSKSKALDIDSSKSLIEYLFEEDEVEISQEYQQQEQTIRKLLYQFKITKEQIDDIANKQTDLRRLNEHENKKNEAALELDKGNYILAYQNKEMKQDEYDKSENDLINKESRLDMLRGHSKTLMGSVEEAKHLAQREQQIFTDLAGKQSLFEKLERLQAEEKTLHKINTEGLMDEVPPGKVLELLEKDARFYEENIYKSREVLKRYATVKSMERKKAQQDEWLKSQFKTIDDKDVQLTSFRNTLQEVEQNNLFVQALTTSHNLSKLQQAVLVHFRSVLLSKPQAASEGMRYTESADLINDLDVVEDKKNNGWWLRTGQLQEFVQATPMLLPDLSKVAFENIGQLEAHLDTQSQVLKAQKALYDGLQNGIMSDEFREYDFDIDLSDATKIKAHRLAAQLCAVVNYKIEDLRRQQKIEEEEIEIAKQQYGITLEGVDYETLLQETKKRYDQYQANFDDLQKQLNDEKSEIAKLETALPFLAEKRNTALKELEISQSEFIEQLQFYKSKYPREQLPEVNASVYSLQVITQLQKTLTEAAGNYINEYNQIVGKYNETKDQRDIRVNEQVRNQNFCFEILEQALLGIKIRTLDQVTEHLEILNAELLAIADDLLESLIKVFGKTETYFDKYKGLVGDLNDFFRGKLISNRFYFRLDFDPAPKLDIKWIEYLRRSATGIAAARVSSEVSPEQFIEDIYMKYSGNKSRIDIEELLNPKRYFVLKGRLTDKNDRDIPGSTGESYTAIALLGIARLSVVQDGDRSGLRFIILEESATLDNVNFSLFPKIAREYGYQIITMTPKPYAIGDDDGWFIHQLIPGKENEDINYPKTMSYFRTNKSKLELTNYLNARGDELAVV